MLRQKETFEANVRQNAMEFDAADLDRSRTLDFAEYSAFVREREVGIFPEAVLRKRFDDTDTDGDGRISMKEYIIWSLRDALHRTVARVRDLFMQWDDDNSSSIDRKEWRKAMKVLGIAANKEELDAVFAEFDDDCSGTVTFAELDRQLRKKYPLPEGAEARDVAVSAQKMHELRSGPSGKVGRTFSANVLEFKEGDAGGKSIQDQLRDALAANLTRVIDLFREWDDDGNGLIDKKEFRQALIGLGYSAPKAEVNTLFESFDKDGGGSVDYHELNAMLRRHAEIDAKLKAGAMGKIDLKAKNKLAIGAKRTRVRTSKTLGTNINLSTEKPLVQQLCAGELARRHRSIPRVIPHAIEASHTRSKPPTRRHRSFEASHAASSKPLKPPKLAGSLQPTLISALLALAAAHARSRLSSRPRAQLSTLRGRESSTSSTSGTPTVTARSRGARCIGRWRYLALEARLDRSLKRSPFSRSQPRLPARPRSPPPPRRWPHRRRRRLLTPPDRLLTISST